jgi:hypothetical protein
MRFYFATAVVVLGVSVFGLAALGQSQPTPSPAPAKDPQAIAVVCHHASKKHIKRYVDEFTWRLNDGNVKQHSLQRLDSLVDAVAGKRLRSSLSFPRPHILEQPHSVGLVTPQDMFD